MLTFRFSGTYGVMTEPEILTSGMRGKQLQLEFSPEWENFARTVVFSNGTVTLDVLWTGETMTIPAQVLEKPLKTLSVGVYGVSADGKQITPTIRAEGPRILPGVEPSGDRGTDPELPIWAQLQTMIGQIDDLETQTQESLVAAINEVTGKIPEAGEPGAASATFIPAVSEEGILSWTNDQGLENPEPVCLMGAEGSAGKDGLSIYTTGENAPVVEEVGVEAEFALAEIVIPDGRNLSEGDFLFMEFGSVLLRITAVDATAGVVAAVYLATLKGETGQKGDAPVRGTDYWTEEDKAEIKAYVDEAILGGAW